MDRTGLLGGLVLICLCIFAEKIASRMQVILICLPTWVPPFLRNGLHKVWNSLAGYRTLFGGLLLILLAVPLQDKVLGVFLSTAVERALHLSIPIFALIWIRSIVFVIQTMPGSLSGQGFREGTLVILLPRYRVDPASAMAFSLFLFGFAVVMGLIGGVLEAGELLLCPSNQANSKKAANATRDETTLVGGEH